MKEPIKKFSIRGERIIFRHINLADARGYFEAHQNKEAKENFMRVPKSLAEARKEIKGHIQRPKEKRREMFVIEVDGEFAGFIRIGDLKQKKNPYEGILGYGIHPKFRRKGLALKSVKLITNYAFKKYKLKRIVGRCRVSNKGSVRVLEKAGYKLEGIHRKELYKNGKFYDNMYWARVK